MNGRYLREFGKRAPSERIPRFGLTRSYVSRSSPGKITNVLGGRFEGSTGGAELKNGGPIDKIPLLTITCTGRW